MSNLRILKKRDGSQQVEEHPDPYGHNICTCPKVMCQFWHKQDIPIVEEPEAEKSLNDKLHDIYLKGSGRDPWDDVAQAAEAWFLTHGWKEPE